MSQFDGKQALAEHLRALVNHKRATHKDQRAQEFDLLDQLFDDLGELLDAEPRVIWRLRQKTGRLTGELPATNLEVLP